MFFANEVDGFRSAQPILQFPCAREDIYGKDDIYGDAPDKPAHDEESGESRDEALA